MMLHSPVAPMCLLGPADDQHEVKKTETSKVKDLSARLRPGNSATDGDNCEESEQPAEIANNAANPNISETRSKKQKHANFNSFPTYNPCLRLDIIY